jgi:hypothetical protein
VFSLSADASDWRSWKVIRHEDGTTTAERLHEDKTLKRQRISSSAMVFVPTEDGSEPEPTVEEIEDIEQELEDMGIEQERQAAIARMKARGEPTEAPRGLKGWGLADGQQDSRMIPLGDGGYLTGKAPTEGED